MGTQFSKIKVTQRVELHGDVFDYADGDYDTEELPDLFTRRAHHSGVISGHELLSYSFLGGQACEPRRSLRRKHRSKSLYSSFRSTASSSASSRMVLCSGSREQNLDILGELKGPGRNVHSSNSSSPPDSELDSGISVNVNYEGHEPRYGSVRNTNLDEALKRRLQLEEDGSESSSTDGLNGQSKCIFFLPHLN